MVQIAPEAYRLAAYIRPFQGTARRSRKRMTRSKAQAIAAITTMPGITVAVCRDAYPGGKVDGGKTAFVQPFSRGPKADLTAPGCAARRSSRNSAASQSRRA
ncbi:hypothetical protein [Jiella sp. M17.18]|uniref:hypothetical protein n=1 Tax=Jiella sp. M17.18 TaxID=3234247 RepID=UPI0034DF0854